jgi:hypothetical protein
MMNQLMAGWADDRKPNGLSLLGFMLFSPTYVLNVEDDDDGEGLRTRKIEIHSELAELNAKAMELARQISGNFEELFG